jgi:hypothetical protein
VAAAGGPNSRFDVDEKGATEYLGDVTNGLSEKYDPGPTVAGTDETERDVSRFDRVVNAISVETGVWIESTPPSRFVEGDVGLNFYIDDAKNIH